MGAYRSKPVTDKHIVDGENGRLRYCAAAMQGWRRTMEDAHVAVPELKSRPHFALFGVFDGHGGAEVARFCQKYMVHVVLEQLACCKDSSCEECLTTAFHTIDDMLRDGKYVKELESFQEEEAGQAGASCIGSLMHMLTSKGVSCEPGAMLADEEGCTSIVALLQGADLWVANVGDSRGVMCRGGKAIALSEDHTPNLRGEYSRILQAGGRVVDTGDVSRVNGELSLSRAIGDLKFKSNRALPAKDQIITAQPDVRRFNLLPEDAFFVLACDGVWDVMTNQQVVSFIEQRLAHDIPLQSICTDLLDSCLATRPNSYGCDNMTLLVVQFKSSLAQTS